MVGSVRLTVMVVQLEGMICSDGIVNEYEKYEF